MSARAFMREAAHPNQSGVTASAVRAGRAGHRHGRSARLQGRERRRPWLLAFLPVRSAPDYARIYEGFANA